MPICHGQIVRKPPVFELVAATPRRGVAFGWVRIPIRCKKRPTAKAVSYPCDSISACYNRNEHKPTSVPDAFLCPWILPRAKKCPPDTFCTSLRTGAALSNPFSSLPIRKPGHFVVGFSYWQRMRDSNPRKRSQSPVCYRYTNPLSGTVLLYATI